MRLGRCQTGKDGVEIGCEQVLESLGGVMKWGGRHRGVGRFR